MMRSGCTFAILLAVTLAAGAAAQECPFTLTLPWSYANETVVDLSEKIDVDGESPLAATTVCTCPAGDTVPVECTCTGPAGDDCDVYAQGAAALFLFGEKFMGVFMHLGEMQAEYHIENVAFWTILGTIFTWIGLLLVLYSEIKAVMITRERDERDRLVNMQFLTKDIVKCEELMESEEKSLAPRPYLTMGGFILFWIGTLCQFIPFCNVLGLIFPGLDLFEGMCGVFVVVGTLILSAASFLFIVGLCWSCTRGWAALVLILVALMGDVMVFGGLISIGIWLVLAAVTFYVYFGYIPSLYLSEQPAEWLKKSYVMSGEVERGHAGPLPKPEWLQDLGNWYAVGTDMDTWKKNLQDGSESMTAEGRAAFAGLPGGKEALEASDKAVALAKEQAEKAKAAAEAAAGGQNKGEV